MDKNNLMNNENISDINNNPFITENKITISLILIEKVQLFID